jgi:L-histidine Nalpha-methyltransferase
MPEGADGASVAASLSEGPEAARLRDEVWDLLQRTPRQLSPKWFYDTRGSELFEAITRQPEYYLTRTEQALLERWVGPVLADLAPATLIELGAGSARKTRVLLDAMEARHPGGCYVPVDVSAEFLADTARALRGEYPSLTVEPRVADLSRPFRLPEDLPRPVLVALLGSTIGNFQPGPAARLLGRVRAALGPDDAFLMGADLRPGPGKAASELEAAYNDAAGVTEAFNRNILDALNRDAGTDFDSGAYAHRAHYDTTEGRIEMHLVATRPDTVTVPGRGRLRLEPGDSVRTEISCKYDRPTLEAIFADAGLRVARWVTDERERYALVLGAPS